MVRALVSAADGAGRLSRRTRAPIAREPVDALVGGGADLPRGLHRSAGALRRGVDHPRTIQAELALEVVPARLARCLGRLAGAVDQLGRRVTNQIATAGDLGIEEAAIVTGGADGSGRSARGVDAEV